MPKFSHCPGKTSRILPVFRYSTMDVIALKQLETNGALTEVEKFLTRVGVQNGSAALYQYASAYFVRRGKPAKSLEYYSYYLTSTHGKRRDSEAMALAIDCAHRLQKHALVREYFFQQDPAERQKLPTATLLVVAKSFISLNALDDAEKIIVFLRERSGAPQLKTFDALIEQKFGGLAHARQFIASALPVNKKPQSNKHAMEIALALMADRQYAAAENLLTTFVGAN